MTHFTAKKRIQTRLKQEQGTVSKAGTRFRMGLAYPNHYYFGMSNLGFQTLYRIFNDDPEVACERLFLPEEDVLPEMGPGSLSTYESQTPADRLDWVAFSISYQNDYLNLLPMLHLMKIPGRSERRGESDPIILAGGPAVTINPEPIAKVVDAFVIGEGEEVAPRILEILKSDATREEKLKALDRLDGLYVPSVFQSPYVRRATAVKPNSGFGLVSGIPNGTSSSERFIKRLVCQNDPKPLAQSEVLTPDTEFGDLYLLEVQRGCQWGCRFCAAGYMYRYPRYDALQNLRERVDVGLRYRPKLGLIAGDLLGYEGIDELLDYIDFQGGAFSPSSVRLNAFTPKIIQHLRKSGNKTIAIAPEAGSERLRRRLNKTFTNQEIIDAALSLAEGGILNIKLYVMIGLPTEEWSDMEELCEMTIATRQALTSFAKRSGKMPNLTLSVSPFVPKPSTPLQYLNFAGIDDLKEKQHWIRKKLLPKGHIRFGGESVLEALIETLLSRGGQETVEFLEKALVPVGQALQVGSNGHLKQTLQNLSFDPEHYIGRVWDPEECAPWDHINHGIKKSYFQREMEKFAKEKITHHCMPEVCRSCGVC